ncbi:MAG: hypothetical protein AUJ48_01675 [Deltaproteobacteria bacterium CG1_02_45_11]|nr:MAG: hypothetical protein AUJ48_01675 [Deltaproteobacteria bacterium CG1_02_45_11]
MKKKEIEKSRLKKDFKRLFKSMDFVCDNYLSKEGLPDKEREIFAGIYQQLGQAWEFMGLQCEHWDGYKKTKDKKEVCRICGKVKGVKEGYIMLPAKGPKKIGREVKPTSKKTYPTKGEAQVLKDSIFFHGAHLQVDVHNSYKAGFPKGKHEINIAAERNVTLKERGIEYSIGQYRIDIDIGKSKKKGAKPAYGNFAFELRKKDLKHFPVIFKFDDDFKFLGLTILR